MLYTIHMQRLESVHLETCVMFNVCGFKLDTVPAVLQLHTAPFSLPQTNTVYF